MSILLKNGLLVDPANDIERPRDLLLEDGLVVAVEVPGSFAAMEKSCGHVIDCSSKWIVPGLVDLHVHLREPGQEWKETILSGSQAAVLGGFTSICCMPNTTPTNDQREITEFIVRRSKEAELARVLPIGSVTKGLLGKEMSPYSELAESGCVAFSDDGEPVWNAGIMRRALEWCAMHGVTIACHEEDKSISAGGCMNESKLSTRMGLKGWPKISEEIMVARDIELARDSGAAVHICHVSTARSVELVRRGKNDGIKVTCEVTPHHLFLSEDAVADYDTAAKMSPPLRAEEDIEALRAGIADGTIDAIASDHAPHDRDCKDLEFARAAFGIIGLQSSLPLLLELIANGVVSLSRGIELVTYGAARAFNLPYGRLDKGKAADIVIVDPHFPWIMKEEMLSSISKNTPFIGRQMLGIAETVLVNGRVVVEGRHLKSDFGK